MTNLPDAELEVLACLNGRGQATVRELREAMESYRPMAHASVLTLLTRLEGKGLVKREKGPGKSFIYSPTQRSKTTTRDLLKRLLQRVFHGDGVALVTSLFQSKPPTAEELDKLQRLVDELRLQRSRKSM